MAKMIINGEVCSGSNSYASAVEYIKDDGSKTTVQDELREHENCLGGLNFAQDAEGNWGYIPSGADSVIPFKSAVTMDVLHIESPSANTVPINLTLDKNYKYVVCFINQTSSASAGNICSISPTREKVVAYGTNYNSNIRASLEIFYDCKNGDVITTTSGQWFLAEIIGFN